MSSEFLIPQDVRAHLDEDGLVVLTLHPHGEATAAYRMPTVTAETLAWQLLCASVAVTAYILDEVFAERRKQIIRLGWTPKHDDGHVDGALAAAAAALAWPPHLEGPWLGPPWAFDLGEKHDRRNQLVIAAALIVAEIERLDREQAAQGGSDGE